MIIAEGQLTHFTSSNIIYIYIYIYGFKNIVIINKIIKLFRFFIMLLLFIKGIINKTGYISNYIII